MAIVESASAPADITNTTGSGTAVTTASFSPPASSLLLVIYAGMWSSVVASDTISDSRSLTWTKALSASSSSNGGIVTIWYTYLASAPGSMTISVTPTLGTGAGNLLVTKVLTGAASNQTGAAGVVHNPGSTLTTAASIALTTTLAGSVVYGISDDPNTNDTFTIGSGTTTIHNYNNSTNGATAAAWKASAATVTPGSVTLGGTWSASCYSLVAALEILPSGTSQLATATLAGSGSLTPAGTLGKASASVLQGAGSIATTGTLNQAASSVLVGQGTFTTTAFVSGASSLLTGSGQLSVAAFQTYTDAALLTGEGDLSAPLVRVAPSNAVLTGAGAVVIADPSYIAVGSASLIGRGVLTTAYPLSLTIMTAVLAGRGIIASIPAIPLEVSQAALTGSGQLTDGAVDVRVAQDVLHGSGTLLDAVIRAETGSVLLLGTGALHPAVGRKTFPTVGLAGKGRLTDTAVHATAAVVVLHGSGLVPGVVSRRYAEVRALLQGTGHLSPTSRQTRALDSILRGSGHFSALARQGGHGTSALTGRGGLLVHGVTLFGTTTMTGHGVLLAAGVTGFTGHLIDMGAVRLKGNGKLGPAQRLEITNATTTLVGGGTFAIEALAYLVTPIVLAGHGALSDSTYTPVFPIPVAPQFTTAPFSVITEPLQVAFTVITRS